MTKTNLLFVCESNYGRSPTAEWLMSGENDYKVKSCGTSSRSSGYKQPPWRRALSKCTKAQFKWADRIIVMEDKQKRLITPKNKVEVLNVWDLKRGWLPCEKELVKLIKDRLEDKGLHSSKQVGENMRCLKWFAKEKGRFLDPLEKEGLSEILMRGY